MISADELQDAMRYDPATGIFTLLRNTSRRKAGEEPGSNHHQGYRTICVGGKPYLAHRLAWLYMTGEWPADDIDHRDLNRKNNKWENLREADKSKNGANCRAYSHNKSGIKGVSLCKKTGRWRADITKNGKGRLLGRFGTKEAAAAAYASAARELHGEFARTA